MLLGCVVGGHSNEDTHYSTQREMWHYVGWPPSWAPRPETLYLSSSLALQGKRVTKFFCIIRIKYDITAAKLLSCPSKGLAKAVDVFYTHFVMVCVMCICVCVLCVQGVCVCVCVCVCINYCIQLQSTSSLIPSPLPHLARHSSHERLFRFLSEYCSMLFARSLCSLTF